MTGIDRFEFYNACSAHSGGDLCYDLAILLNM